MINFWSFTNNVKDSIGTAHLYSGVNAYLTNDRFGVDNLALRLNLGYYTVPPGVYFNGPFTTSVWVNAKSFSAYARVFDFGENGINTDNVVFSIFKDTPSAFYFTTFSGSNQNLVIDCSYGLLINEWSHLAVTFDGGLASFYFNGEFSCSSSIYQPKNITRKVNYIGKSNWPDELPNAVYDELRIYNRVLDSNEINSLMFF